jgi:para-nitrobenzyl esterase
MKKQSWIRFATLGFCLGFAAALGYAPAASAQACEVTIDSGAVAGVAVGQSCVFKGIPYAASPAGARRWHPPAPVAPWGGVLSAASFGNICPQLQGTTEVGNEDCLNLNIFAPANATPPLPVIFFLHGGGHRASSNRAEGGESLDGQYLAEHGPAVVVVINYRLGAIGWLAHPALDAESATGTSGNYGILDQIAALQWVQRNIAAFGGDPSRVTVTGHSAGAGDSGVLLASPLARGLFASVLIDGAGPANFDQPTLADYEATIGADIVTKLGCAAALDIPACLRAVPSATIVKTVPGAVTLKNPSPYKPIVDGFVLNETALSTAKEGEHNHVPLIIGGGDKESSGPAFVPVAGIATAADYQAALYDLLGQQLGDQTLALYPVANYPTPRLAFVAATTDYRWICPARRLAWAVTNSQKEPVYRFVYTHAQSGPPAATALGAWHGQELMFIFHSFTSGVSGPFTPTAAELELSDQIIGYWARFAATQTPNGADALPWFVYGQNADNNGPGHMFFTTDATGEAKREPFLRLDTPLAEGSGFHTEVCDDFWDKLAGDTNNGHGEAVNGDREGLADDNAGNEPFLTKADLNNDDQR